MYFIGAFTKTTEKFEGAIEICVNSVGICLEHDYVKTVEVNYVSVRAEGEVNILSWESITLTYYTSH